MPHLSHAWNQRCFFPWFPTARPNPRATSSRPQWLTQVPVMISPHRPQSAHDVRHGQIYCIPAHCPNRPDKIFLFIWVKQLSYRQCANSPVRIPRRTATQHLLPEDIQHRSGNAKLKAIKKTRKLQTFRLASEALCLCIFECAWVHVVLWEYLRRTNSIVKASFANTLTFTHVPKHVWYCWQFVENSVDISRYKATNRTEEYVQFRKSYQI